MRAFTPIIAIAGIAHATAPRATCSVDDFVATDSAVVFRGAERRQVLRNVSSSLALDVHFHITTNAANADLVTDEIVAAQWDALHDIYAQYNITLTLSSTERVVDELAGAQWFMFNGTSWNNYPEEKKAFFKERRKGGYDELNLYFFAPGSPGTSGYCTFPTVVNGTIPKKGDDAYVTDGCQISALSMPGIPDDRATLPGYTLGHVAVHETGHWLGLNHTFIGGCSEPGDFVADTPATALVYDCPVGSDTCPGVAGLDPIHNFMSYTNDTCTFEFTPGQKARMFETFYTYRRTA